MAEYSIRTKNFYRMSKIHEKPLELMMERIRKNHHMFASTIEYFDSIAVLPGFIRFDVEPLSQNDRLHDHIIVAVFESEDTALMAKLTI